MNFVKFYQKIVSIVVNYYFFSEEIYYNYIRNGENYVKINIVFFYFFNIYLQRVPAVSNSLIQKAQYQFIIIVFIYSFVKCFVKVLG